MKNNYKNKFLGIEAPAAHGWELTSVQTAKITHNFEALFQMADDEMPEKDMGMKQLFNYRKFNPSSKAVVDADIEFSIIKIALPQIWNEKTGQFDTLTEKITLNNTEFFISERKEDTQHWTFLYAPYDANYWFYAKIAVHKPELDAETMAVFEGISFFKTALNNTIISPNFQHEISFGASEEQSMGGAYYCPIFIKNTEGSPKMLLHERSIGNAVWKGSNAVFFPIWVRTDKGLMQQIAFYDLKKSRISIFERLYNFVEIKAIKGNLISAIESPHWQPKNIVIDIKNEKVEKTISWAQIDSDITAIKNRLLNATGGNWYYFQEGRDHTSGSSFIMTNVENQDDWNNPNRGEDLEISGATHADNEFIAHARQDIPLLLAEIERLKALIK